MSDLENPRGPREKGIFILLSHSSLFPSTPVDGRMSPLPPYPSLSRMSGPFQPCRTFIRSSQTRLGH